MAAMTTALTEFADNGNSRTYVRTATHTALLPRLVLQRRKVPVGNQKMLEDTVLVLSATTNPAGATLSERVTMEVKVRRPIDGVAATVTADLAILRDIVASDEFGSMITTQNWLKA